MEKQRLYWLIEQHLANRATPQEAQELAALVHADDDQAMFKTVLAEMMEQQEPVYPGQDMVWQKMVQDIIEIDKPSQAKPASGIFRLTRWAAAAAVLIVAGLAVYFLVLNKPQRGGVATHETGPALAATPVHKNVLTLSNGSQVLLDEIQNGKIAAEGNTGITKKDARIVYTATRSGDGTYYNVLSTAPCGLYEVVLPDGSHVWLNAASSIRFPASFTGRERLVELSGEAWFDVRHAGNIPFLIRSGAITTAVLGTAFDVKAYPGQTSMIVSVQRGRVMIQANDKTLTTLQKGQQVRVMADTSFHQKNIDTNAIATWRTGDLYYKDETVKDIIADLQRVFNCSIVIKRAALEKEVITVSFHKSSGSQKALDIICRITDARLSIINGTFIIE